MKENRTRIAIILDRSGSMSSVRESTVTGFNAFIKKQREVPGDVTVKLVQFDDYCDVVFDKPLSEVPELTQANFVPRGSTALYDAQGKTIVALGEELSTLSENERPSKVIVMTLTDGQENASKEYRLATIASMIKDQQEKYSWDFVFLGANQDAILTAKSMNIRPQSSLTYSASPQGMMRSMAMASNYVNSSRTVGAVNSAFSAQDRADAIDQKDISGLGAIPANGGVLGGKDLTWEELLKRQSIIP